MSDWKTPEELVENGFNRTSVVMMNEAHNGLLRCVRTRRIGKRVLPVAHEQGVRYMAMEALWDRVFTEKANHERRLPESGGGYLAQPEMREFIQAALDLVWDGRFSAYEADMTEAKERFEDLLNEEVTNWREEVQAQNLVELLGSLPSNARMLVWCGNGHLIKNKSDSWWVPMGHHFRQLSGMEPFVIDQIRTVKFPGNSPEAWLTPEIVEELKRRGGTAGMLEDGERCDAFLLSLDNELE